MGDLQGHKLRGPAQRDVFLREGGRVDRLGERRSELHRRHVRRIRLPDGLLDRHRRTYGVDLVVARLSCLTEVPRRIRVALGGDTDRVRPFLDVRIRRECRRIHLVVAAIHQQSRHRAVVGRDAAQGEPLGRLAECERDHRRLANRQNPVRQVVAAQLNLHRRILGVDHHRVAVEATRVGLARVAGKVGVTAHGHLDRAGLLDPVVRRVRRRVAVTVNHHQRRQRPVRLRHVAKREVRHVLAELERHRRGDRIVGQWVHDDVHLHRRVQRVDAELGLRRVDPRHQAVPRGIYRALYRAHDIDRDGSDVHVRVCQGIRRPVGRARQPPPPGRSPKRPAQVIDRIEDQRRRRPRVHQLGEVDRDDQCVARRHVGVIDVRVDRRDPDRVRDDIPVSRIRQLHRQRAAGDRMRGPQTLPQRAVARLHVVRSRRLVHRLHPQRRRSHGPVIHREGRIGRGPRIGRMRHIDLILARGQIVECPRRRGPLTGGGLMVAAAVPGGLRSPLRRGECGVHVIDDQPLADRRDNTRHRRVQPVDRHRVRIPGTEIAHRVRVALRPDSHRAHAGEAVVCREGRSVVPPIVQCPDRGQRASDQIHIVVAEVRRRLGEREGHVRRGRPVVQRLPIDGHDHRRIRPVDVHGVRAARTAVPGQVRVVRAHRHTARPRNAVGRRERRTVARTAPAEVRYQPVHRRQIVYREACHGLAEHEVHGRGGRAVVEGCRDNVHPNRRVLRVDAELIRRRVVSLRVAVRILGAQDIDLDGADLGVLVGHVIRGHVGVRRGPTPRQVRQRPPVPGNEIELRVRLRVHHLGEQNRCHERTNPHVRVVDQRVNADDGPDDPDGVRKYIPVGVIGQLHGQRIAADRERPQDLPPLTVARIQVVRRHPLVDVRGTHVARARRTVIHREGSIRREEVDELGVAILLVCNGHLVLARGQSGERPRRRIQIAPWLSPPYVHLVGTSP